MHVAVSTDRVSNQSCVFLSVSQVCHANPSERSRFIRCIYNLLNSSSAAVRYEAAGTLVTLSSAPTAVRVSTAPPRRGRGRTAGTLAATRPVSV